MNRLSLRTALSVMALPALGGPALMLATPAVSSPAPSASAAGSGGVQSSPGPSSPGGVTPAPASAPGAVAANPPLQPDSTDPVERGRYLATAADCAACHTAPGGRDLAGGYKMATPMGVIYSSNITPSKTAGIGNYTQEQFTRALRQGVRADGAKLYPAMPYTSYTGLSDADVAALYTYFMKGVKPVDAAPPQTQLKFPFNMRWIMTFWNALYLNDARFQQDANKTPEWNRGAYLAGPLEHCSVCHSPRGFMMQEKRDQAMSGAPLGAWFAPNVTSHPVAGIGNWSVADLMRYFRTGDVPGKAQAAGGMAEAIEHSLSKLPDADLRAIAVWLKATTPVDTGAGDKPRYAYGAAKSVEPALRGVNADSVSRGAKLYSGSCASCHQPAGNGTTDSYYPTLFNNSVTGASNPNNLVATILYGVQRKGADGNEVFMPGFAQGAHGYVDDLSDQDVADIANFVFTSFGNPATQVDAATVTSLRNGGPTPLIVKLASLTIPGLIVGVLALVGLLWWWRSRRKRHDHANAATLH